MKKKKQKRLNEGVWLTQWTSTEEKKTPVFVFVLV